MQRYAAVFAVVLVLFGPAASLNAVQTPQPADEVAALRAQVGELEKELQAARARIAELEKQLAKAQGSPVQPTEIDLGEVAERETASPDHLLARLKAEFADLFPDPPPQDERGLRQHLRVLSQWTNKINRGQRQRINWVCEIFSRDLIDADEGYVDLFVVDPSTGEPVGSRFVIEWPRRLRSALARFPDGSQVQLRGLLAPELRTNESRAETGAFDIPPLVGPYVEFRFDVQVTSIGPVEKQPPVEKKAPVETEPDPER